MINFGEDIGRACRHLDGLIDEIAEAGTEFGLEEHALPWLN